MSETERPKLANLVSVVFILGAMVTIGLEYWLSIKPISTGPAIDNLLAHPLLQLSLALSPAQLPQLFSAFYISSSLSLQMSASFYLTIFIVSVIMAIILIASAFGYAYRKKWGYYLSLISSVFLIVTPVITFILGYAIIWIAISVFAAILGLFFIWHLTGVVKKEF